MLQQTEAPGLGGIEVFGLTALFEKASGDVTAPPPTLGQHNGEIYARLGLNAADLAGLKAKGVI